MWRRQRGARRRRERRFLSVWAVPTGRADSRGGRGARTSGYPVRRRREVRGASRCTQAWVSFTGPVPRLEREVNQEL